MTSQSYRAKVMAVLSRDYAEYLKAEAKLKQSIIAARSTDLDGNVLWSYQAIATTLGVTRQAIQQYVKRWSEG